jgi:hypothetical protein
MDSINTLIDNSSTEVASSSFGFRARLIFSDGINADTEDVSRMVRSTRGDAYPVNPLQWTPLRTTLSLNDSGLIDRVMIRSIPNSQTWGYDKTKMRIFRYSTVPGAGDTNHWLEYTDSQKDLFRFLPGRIVWLKSLSSMQVLFGGGKTQSLSKSSALDLKPGTWTDVTLPYQFPVMLRDILETTGIEISKNLEVYQWVWTESQKAYTAKPLYIGILLDTALSKIKDTVTNNQLNNAYLVYNHHSIPVSLEIPPICLPLSKYATGYPAKSSGKSVSKWLVKLQWRIAPEESDYSSVFLGYNPDLTPPAFYGPLPPGMSTLRVGVVDTGKNLLCGYSVNTDIREGGTVYFIDFVNSGDQGVMIGYKPEVPEELPEGFAVRILNPVTMQYEDAVTESAVSVAAGTSQRRVVVVGDETYFEIAQSRLTPWNLQFVKAYPNPFRGYIKLFYTIPAGMKEIRFTIYDMHGRTVWNDIHRETLTRGIHVFTYDGSTGASTRRTLSSGLYIVRMSAVNNAGVVVYGGEKKITCIQ